MKGFARDAGLTLLSHAVGVVAVISAQVLLARQVPLEVFGQFAAAQVLVGLVEIVAVSRGGEVALQFFGRHWTDPDERFNALYGRLLRDDVLYALACFVLLAPVALLADSRFHLNGWFILALAAGPALQIGHGLRKAFFVIEGRIDQQAVSEIVGNVGLLALAIPLIAAFGAWGMIAAVLSAALLKNVFIHLLTDRIRRPGLAWRAALPAEVAREIRSASGHSVFRTFSMYASGNADILLLSAFGRPEVIAVYRVAKTLAGIPARAAAPWWVALRPRLLAAAQVQDDSQFRRAVVRLSAVLAVGGLAVAPFAWLLGPRVLSLAYGQAYAEAVPALCVLLVGGALMGAATGWLPFVLVVSTRKAFGSALYFAQLALTVILGVTLGAASALHMAVVVAACAVIVAALAWIGLVLGVFRPRSIPEPSAG